MEWALERAIFRRHLFHKKNLQIKVKKKSVLKFPEFFICKMLFAFLQIARNETESKIPYIESHSSIVHIVLHTK